MKKVAVIGAKGNMGKRYCLILKKYTDCEVVEIDIDEIVSEDVFISCDGFIIATPTETHINLIKKFSIYGMSILCEKPISKNIDEIKLVIDDLFSDLSMINQYHFLDDPSATGPTYYNYFKTGGDGLAWDCINIIGNARTSYNIMNDSVKWHCMLNGRLLSIAQMDQAYIDNIVGWVNGWRNKDYIIPAHEKVLKHEKNK